MASHDVNVLATLGSALSLDASAEAGRGGGGGGNAVPADGFRPGGAEVRYVPFVPLDELLGGVDAVVTAGGAGTVLGTLARGVPMVLWPQGADQPINAARAAASGVAITVDSAAGIPEALTAVLASDSAYRRRAREAAAEIAHRPGWDDVVGTSRPRERDGPEAVDRDVHRFPRHLPYRVSQRTAGPGVSGRPR
ncbi:nucleotide disphospho-sugar-binding domain-containing protein [Streptomyces sp. M19]